ncbi:MAG: aminopeptidase [Gemmatimonadaceae bacterium]|nr:aminopeptidase [Gemmatimonadaceae bacterium]
MQTVSGGRLKLRWGGVGLVLLGIVAVGGVLLAATPTGRYLVRAAWEEGKILRGRRSIEGIVRQARADSAASTAPQTASSAPALDAVTVGKLELVLQARDFARDSLGFPVKETFTQFTQLERDTLVLVLSGARQDALVAKTWWFPVVGRVPYKGFFDFDAARKAERAVQREGYDTYLRPASAFSTLGWFNDPLLSSTLRADSVDLVNTVIHELTHNHYFAKNEVVFNESFANFVGARGAERFFLARADSFSARQSVARWADDRVLAAYWAVLYRSVDSAFKAHEGDSLRSQRITLRDSIYSAARRTLVDSIAPLLRTLPPAYAERVKLDNAALMGRRIYLTDLEAFEREYEESGGDLLRAVSSIVGKHRRGAWGVAVPE